MSKKGRSKVSPFVIFLLMPQNKNPKIETWKDILNKTLQNTRPNTTHKWVLTGGYSRLPGRSLSGVESEVTERYHIYKCIKCGITAKKYQGDDTMVVDDAYKGLSCDQAIVQDILD